MGDVFRGPGSRPCCRPGCLMPAAASLSYDYGSAQIWIEPLREEPGAVFDLCSLHIGRFNPPAGWRVHGSERHRVSTERIESEMAASAEREAVLAAVLPDEDLAPEHPKAEAPSPPGAKPVPDGLLDDFAEQSIDNELENAGVDAHSEPAPELTYEPAQDGWVPEEEPWQEADEAPADQAGTNSGSRRSSAGDEAMASSPSLF